MSSKVNAYNREKTGERIRLARERRKLTRAELARTLDVSEKFIGEVERGAKGLSLDKFAVLCKSLMLSPDTLLFGAEGTETKYGIMGMINRCDAKKLPYLERMIKSFLDAYCE